MVGDHDPADDRLDLRGRDARPCRRACARAPTGSARPKLRSRTRVVFPAALSGIVAAIVLGVSRAIGETMIVLIAAGLHAEPRRQPAEASQTMTTFIGATGKGDVPTGTTGYKTIFAVGTTLFLLTLLMNSIAIRFVRKYREVYE